MERARANDAEKEIFRRSSNDSGFGSVGDSDEALERQKALHAKEKMSRLPYNVTDSRNGKPGGCVEVEDFID